MSTVGFVASPFRSFRTWSSTLFFQDVPGIYNKQAKYSKAIEELELYLKKVKDVKDRAGPAR